MVQSLPSALFNLFCELISNGAIIFSANLLLNDIELILLYFSRAKIKNF